MTESLVSASQERLLAALFVRSNIKNRRRRYAAGYLMSELDGVTLSQSEIFVDYRHLQDRGYIVSAVINGDLLLKLTEDGDLYCRQVIYPDLLANLRDGSAGTDLAKAPLRTSDFPELEGLRIEQIVERLQADPALAERIANAAAPEGALPEASRGALRSAAVALSGEVEKLQLSNTSAAQVQNSIQIVMILADAPAADKGDITRFLGIAADLLQVGTFARDCVLAIIAYLLLC